MKREWEEAARRGDTSALRAQIASGAHVDTRDRYGQSALMLAAAGADLANRGSGAPGFAGKTAAGLARDGGLTELAAALTRPPSASEAQMTEHEATDLVSRIADEIWNEGRLDVCDEVMAPDARYYGPHMPGGVADRETWRRAIEMYRSAFPDSHVVYDELLAFGETVVGRWTATATHTGPLPGLEPTGREISIGGIQIFRLRNGRIVEGWEQLDMLGMWRQLGVVTLPDHGS